VTAVLVLGRSAHAEETDERPEDPDEDIGQRNPPGYKELWGKNMNHDYDEWPRKELFAMGAFTMAREITAMTTETTGYPLAMVGVRRFFQHRSSVSFGAIADTSRGGLLAGGELHKRIGDHTFVDFGLGAGAYFIGARAVVARARIGLTYFSGKRLAYSIGPTGTFVAGADDGELVSLGAGIDVGISYEWGERTDD